MKYIVLTSAVVLTGCMPLPLPPVQVPAPEPAPTTTTDTPVSTTSTFDAQAGQSYSALLTTQHPAPSFAVFTALCE